MGKDMPPAQLQAMGLVNRVCSGEAALDEAVNEFTSHIASQSELALHSVKLQFRSLYHRETMGNINEHDQDAALIHQAEPGLIPRLRAIAKSKL